MTRKDYRLIAAAIYECLHTAGYTEDEQRGMRVIANELSTKLERDNPRFDRARFLKACGVDDNA